MTCWVTGDIFKADGVHTPCPDGCGHCVECDHAADTEKRHAHYQDYQSKNARLMPTTNHKIYCHVALCSCDQATNGKRV